MSKAGSAPSRADRTVLFTAQRMAQDSSKAVRREVELSMPEVPFEKSGLILLRNAKDCDGVDRAYCKAFGAGSQGRKREIYRALARDLGAVPANQSARFNGTRARKTLTA